MIKLLIRKKVNKVRNLHALQLPPINKKSIMFYCQIINFKIFILQNKSSTIIITHKNIIVTFSGKKWNCNLHCRNDKQDHTSNRKKPTNSVSSMNESSVSYRSSSGIISSSSLLSLPYGRLIVKLVLVTMNLNYPVFLWLLKCKRCI